MEVKQVIIGRSLAETPTWSVVTVITALVAVGALVHRSIHRFGKWVAKTKRKALLSALEKIKEELMLFGLLSFLLGHWTVWIAEICTKSSSFSTRFYPCSENTYDGDMMHVKHVSANLYSRNHSVFREEEIILQRGYCPEGYEPFVSYDSLGQLRRFLFVLGITHVSYSSFTVALAMLKIYSWRTWESQAKSMAIQSLEGTSGANTENVTFNFLHTSHPWNHKKFLIWMLCFIHQFWSSITRADYMALRLGFITNHNLHLAYDFHNYMLRCMEEEFRDIVGISVPLWGYTIICIFVNIHGTNAYFWLSFIPAILILMVGTKLHHIMVQLALEINDPSSCTGNQLNLRDELFWFGKPKLLLWLIQLISFQNALEMTTFMWSLWEIKAPSCFMKNHVFLIIRLTSGIFFQFWCSYNTFPLYIIITQMGSRFKKALISESIRESLHRWQKRVNKKPREVGSQVGLVAVRSNPSLDFEDEIGAIDKASVSSNLSASSLSVENLSSSNQPIFMAQCEIYEQPEKDEPLQVSISSDLLSDICYDGDGDGDGDEHNHDDDVNERDQLHLTLSISSHPLYDICYDGDDGEHNHPDADADADANVK